MAKKKAKPPEQPSRPTTSNAKRAAKAGLGAFVLGVLVWLTGGLSRENALEWAKSICIAVGLALLIRWPVGEPFRIPSSSMKPTLHGDERLGRGDRVWVNKFVYGVRFPLNRSRIPFTSTIIKYADRRLWLGAEPERWDVVVFKSAEENPQHNTLIKRDVGLPGERIHIANGKVYANGKPLELPDDVPDIQYTTPYNMRYGIFEDGLHSVVPKDCYLVLGDNSAHSRDGRAWGWLPNEHILGRAACIWWPPSRWRDFTGFSKTWWWRGFLALDASLLIVRLFFGRTWLVHPKPGDGRRARPWRLYVNRWALGPPVPFTRYRIGSGRPPRRGELVLYHCPTDEGPDHGPLLGRVAGLPGERVHLDAGRLHVNEAPATEPAVLADRTFPSDDAGPFGRSKGKQHTLVPDGHYFILCDEGLSDGSLDSRAVGWVARSALIGIASAVWWPASRWGRIR